MLGKYKNEFVTYCYGLSMHYCWCTIGTEVQNISVNYDSNVSFSVRSAGETSSLLLRSRDDDDVNELTVHMIGQYSTFE